MRLNVFEWRARGQGQGRWAGSRGGGVWVKGIRLVVVGGGVRGFPLGNEFVGGANDGWSQEQWAGHPNF